MQTSSEDTNLGQYEVALQKLKKEISSFKVFSQKLFKDKLRETEAIFRRALRNIFGHEKKLNADSVPLNFQDNNGHSEEVVFACWAYDGSESYKDPTEVEHQARENVFTKGVRWSNKYDQFYSNFRPIKKAFNNYVPFDFFGHYAKACPSPLRIVTSQKLNSPRNPGELHLPVRDACLNMLPEGSIKNLAQYIIECAKGERNVVDNEIINYWNSINNELKNTTNEETIDFLNKLVKSFEEIGIEFEEEEKKKEIALKVLLSFQFYSWSYEQWPYDVYIFRPNKNKKNSSDERNLVCLALAVHKENKKFKDHYKLLQDLCDSLAVYHEIDKTAWSLLQRDDHLDWLWQKEYNKLKDAHDRLRHLVELNLEGFCKEKKIPHVITGRTKEFEKFFDKIVDGANAENMSKDKIPEDKIKNPVNNAKSVFQEHIFDVSGVRVNCSYSNDMDSLFKDINDNLTRLGFTKAIDPEMNKKSGKELVYPRHHIWVKLNEEACPNTLCYGLSGLNCEIQIGTTLNEAWANVSHQLLYKPLGVPDSIKKELEESTVANELYACLGCGLLMDAKFNELREKSQDLLDQKGFRQVE